MEKKKVIVAMSGGVDSSVSAALLHKAGFDVTGIYMKCWASSSGSNPAQPGGLSKNLFEKSCTTDDDERMARLAASHIGIPFYTVNFIAEYKKRVVEYMLEGYKQGITPNPDAMCNREIKFGLFFEKAMELGADYVATGHYARLNSTGNFCLRPHTKVASLSMGKDKNKDQSYFLARVEPSVFEKVLFPIGEYTKPEVRKLAQEFGLPNATRKDSQGICFIGKVPFMQFLQQYIPPKQGNIVDMQGNVLGRHEGAWYYTIGQRKGLGLSGGPYFVVRIHVKDNTVVVSTNEQDLYQKEVYIRDINWFVDPVQEITARIRYRQTPAVASFTIDSSQNSGTLVFKQAQRAVAPGQIAALYTGDQLVASGIID